MGGNKSERGGDHVTMEGWGLAGLKVTMITFPPFEKNEPDFGIAGSGGMIFRSLLEFCRMFGSCLEFC